MYMRFPLVCCPRLVFARASLPTLPPIFPPPPPSRHDRLPTPQYSNCVGYDLPLFEIDEDEEYLRTAYLEVSLTASRMAA